MGTKYALTGIRRRSYPDHVSPINARRMGDHINKPAHPYGRLYVRQTNPGDIAELFLRT
jgi:hypothetical protein